MSIEKEALSLMLRSKTALGRLVDSEVHDVIAFLELIGFKHEDPSAPAAAIPAEPVPVPVAPVPQPVPAPVVAPPPAQ